MADVRRIVDLYELLIHQVKDVQDGLTEEIIPKNRKIVQSSRVLTDLVRQKIYEYLE